MNAATRALWRVKYTVNGASCSITLGTPALQHAIFLGNKLTKSHRDPGTDILVERLPQSQFLSTDSFWTRKIWRQSDLL